jgi:hypothetical protein
MEFGGRNEEYRLGLAHGRLLHVIYIEVGVCNESIVFHFRPRGLVISGSNKSPAAHKKKDVSLFF